MLPFLSPRHRLPRLLALFAAALLTSSAALAQTPATQPARTRGPASRPSFQIAKVPINPNLPTLWLIGDSTVRNGTRDDGGNGQWGWGNPIRHYFDESKINVQNRAVGGTSSRNFQTQQWPWILEEIKAGDYVIMQFGHNDSGNPATDQRFRATLPGNGEETVQTPDQGAGERQDVHTYGWYLRKYISDATEHGAVGVIVCSPIPRNRWSADGKTIPADRFAPWAKEAAAQAKVQFIDLNAMVIKKFESLGKEQVTAVHFPENEAVHPDWAGAVLIAETVIEGLKEIESPLVKYLKPEPPKDLKHPSGRAR